MLPDNFNKVKKIKPYAVDVGKMARMHYAAIGETVSFLLYFPSIISPLLSFDDFSASKERANCINYLEKPGKKGSSIDIHIQISNFSTSLPFSSFIVDSSSVENGGSRGEIRNRPTITRGIYTWKERDRVIDVGPTLARALTINYRDSIRN